MSDLPEPDQDQWWAAVKILLGLLRLQTQIPGAIPSDELPKMLHLAADERDRQGDYGAARLLDEWAQMLAQPLGD